jgi:LysM repeat protein
VKDRSLIPALCLVVIGASGCSGRPAPATALPSATLQPFVSPTTAASRVPPQVTPPAIPSPGATATPFSHTVASNDTLLEIASRYGVDLADLLAANPDVNPRLLTIGQQIIIPDPAADQGVFTAPQVTPHPLPTSEVYCYTAPSDSLICLMLIHNPTEQAFEGVAAAVTLLSRDGEPLASTVGFAPLISLRQTESVPLAVLFRPPTDEGARAIGILLSAIPVDEQSSRAVRLEIINLVQSMDSQGHTATLEGQVLMPESAETPTQARLLATAYDADGRPVGFSLWESPLGESGSQQQFRLVVYSLGPEIARMDLIAEGWQE